MSDMVRTSDPALLVLHVLRLKGFAEVDLISRRTDLDPAEVTQVLTLSEPELVVHREGRISGWALTPGGKEHHLALLAEEVAATGHRAVIEGAYKRFLDLNHDLLRICTEWQLNTVNGEQVINDHTDASYDAAVIEQLFHLHKSVTPICEDLAAALTRFATYGPRLAAAAANVEAGDHRWFTTPMIDSYHDIWFELHEDLLTSLGLERANEK